MSQETVRIDRQADVLIARVQSDELYGEVANELLTRLATETAELETPKVVVDLSEVEFVDSLSLGTLVKTASDLSKKGGKFMVAGVNETVRRTLALTRMNRLFNIQDTVENAVRELSGPGGS